MRRQTRKYGTAIDPIVDPGTGEMLGWVYEWDNGERSQLLLTHLPAALVPGAGPKADEQAQPPS